MAAAKLWKRPYVFLSPGFLEIIIAGPEFLGVWPHHPLLGVVPLTTKSCNPAFFKEIFRHLEVMGGFQPGAGVQPESQQDQKGCGNQLTRS
jgi:hypothetical protein